MFVEKEKRKSHTAEGKIYFWTSTINKWYHLLQPDFNKETIIGSLKNLSDKKLITVYAFVSSEKSNLSMRTDSSKKTKDTRAG